MIYTSGTHFMNRWELELDEYHTLMDEVFSSLKGHDAEMVKTARLYDDYGGSYEDYEAFSIEYEKLLQKIWAKLEIKLDNEKTCS